MKCASKMFLLVALASLLAGCHLNSAPDCLLGQKRCEDNSVLKSGILYVCMENNTWQGMACTAGCKNKTECNGEECIPACDKEGEQFCETMELLSMSFICVNKQWIPTVCASDAVCDGKVCSSQGVCEEGAQVCMYSEVLGSSISAECHDNQWIVSYCQEGLGCDGNVCATEQSVHACGNPSVDCQKLAGWKNGSCEGGQCVATECKNTKLYD